MKLGPHLVEEPGAVDNATAQVARSLHHLATSHQFILDYLLEHPFPSRSQAAR